MALVDSIPVGWQIAVVVLVGLCIAGILVWTIRQRRDRRQMEAAIGRPYYPGRPPAPPEEPGTEDEQARERADALGRARRPWS